MSKQENNPTVVMMVGGPGAGKSFVRNQRFENLPVVDCDKFKENHPDYDPQNILQHVHDYSKVECKRDYFNRLGQGESFVYDGTGTNLERYIQWIGEAHQAGFDVELVYVRCDLQTALKRNRTRARFVPENIVKEKHSTVAIAFDILSGYADRVTVVNNS